ncbi:hypothetical protein DL769_001064 [Monosporascus sp. CRB-8-3]|nr:hypothetical protein DL769_001064 [Monosporascus sp. CRB-8-3]
MGFHCLFALRFLLGASEGCITNGVMLITSMFYNRTKTGQRIGWTFQCNGLAMIVSSFMSFGVAHYDPGRKSARWQLLIIIYTGLTAVFGLWFLLVFPDNPVRARFLSEDEKVKAVRRIQANQSGTETKSWKSEQALEAVKDVKTWLFFLFAAVCNLQNGFGIQYGLIIQSFGFTTAETTALSAPAGAAQIIGVTMSIFIFRRYPKLAVNAIFLIGYALGQILCTQFWREQYKPRNYVPYAICLASYLGDFILLFALRYVLSKENKRRNALQGTSAQEDYGIVKRVDSEGRVIHQKVDRGMLDMTDRQNLPFRYAL